MIAQEGLHHHAHEMMAQQVDEAIVQLESGQPYEHDGDAPNFHIEHDEQAHQHHIEIKEGHACSADCPEHGHSHHEEHGHHRHDAREQERTLGHTIEHKIHACSADCPEHSHSHDHISAEHGHHGHRIETKSSEHTCSADCPEHGQHSHGHHEHHTHEAAHEAEHIIVQKAAEHACSADCPEHGHSHHEEHGHHHEHERQATAVMEENELHIKYEAAADIKQVLTEQSTPVATPQPYQSIEEAVRQTQLIEAAERDYEPQVGARSQVEVTQVLERAQADVVEAVTYPAPPHKVQPSTATVEGRLARQDVLTAVPELAQEGKAGRVETIPDARVDLAGSGIEQGIPDDSLADSGVTAITIPEVSEAASPVLPEPLEFGQALSVSRYHSLEAATEMPVQTTTFEKIEVAENLEPLGSIGIESAPLPVPARIEEDPLVGEAGANRETIEPLLIRATGADDAIQATVRQSEASNEQAVVNMVEVAEALVDTVGRRIEAVERQITAAAPRRAQEIRKTLAVLAELQVAPAAERGPVAMQQLIYLMHLLGYENPAQTITAYIHHYGIDFTDELLARLLELVGRGRSFESLSVHGTPTFAIQQTKDGIMALGTLVLALFKLKGNRYRTVVV